VSQSTWNRVDAYIAEQLVAEDSALDAALADSAAAGLPPINVAPNQGKLLHLLAQIQGAKYALEIGTLGGYSSIWLARALPADGRLVTLEFDPHHAEIARANLARAGLADRVDIHIGAALQTLPKIAANNPPVFDFVFIDADKENIPGYYEWALRLTRPGSVIVVDNVVRNGAVIDAHSADVSVQGVRKFLSSLATDARVSATAVQTVGSKGYDGFALLRVLG
jgi:predicted O-methyltransferase YrrM